MPLHVSCPHPPCALTPLMSLHPSYPCTACAFMVGTQKPSFHLPWHPCAPHAPTPALTPFAPALTLLKSLAPVIMPLAPSHDVVWWGYKKPILHCPCTHHTSCTPCTLVSLHSLHPCTLAFLEPLHTLHLGARKGRCKGARVAGYKSRGTRAQGRRVQGHKGRRVQGWEGTRV